MKPFMQISLVQAGRVGPIAGRSQVWVRKVILTNIYQMLGGGGSGGVLRTLEVLLGFIILTP